MSVETLLMIESPSDRKCSSRQVMVIMELRCSEDYAKFISQAIIESYLKLFINKVQQRPDTNDLDITDYEVRC